MKLLNRTRISDRVLHQILVKAARSVGARSSRVVVQVNPAHQASGRAQRCAAIRLGGRWYDTDGGWFKIALPAADLSGSPDPVTTIRLLADEFVQVAQHEWGHIRDFQNPHQETLTFSQRGRNGRRPRHDSRPEEIRAENYVYDSQQTKGRQLFLAEIDALCDELNRQYNRK